MAMLVMVVAYLASLLFVRGSLSSTLTLPYLVRNTVSSWSHHDYGLGTDVGNNQSGAGHLYDHPSVLGRQAVGMTATSTAHASPAASSDSVYLWEPTQSWNYSGQEWWLKTSFLFPSSASVPSLLPGEATYRPTEGTWNWFFELHNDSNLNADSNERGNISCGLRTDYTSGASNPRLFCREMGGPDGNIQTVYVFENGVGTLTSSGVPLKFDTWYNWLFHVKLDPAHGTFQWYENGVLIYSNTDIPTLYSRPRGYVSPSYTSLTLCHYRVHAAWPSTVMLGPTAVGPTSDSVAPY